MPVAPNYSTQVPTAHRELNWYTDPSSNQRWTASSNAAPGKPFHLSNAVAAATTNTLTIPHDTTQNRVIQLAAVYLTAANATAITVAATITGLAGGSTLTFQLTTSTSVGGLVTFTPGVLLPAADQNTDVVITIPSMTGAATAIVAVGSYA